MSYGWRFVLLASVTLVLTGASGISIAAEDRSATPAAEVAGETTPPPEPPAEKHKLAYKFELNQIVRYEVTNESEMTTHVKGNTETTRNSSKAKRHYKVTAVDEKTGEADLELSIDWAHMQASFEKPDGFKGEPVEFQSDDPNKQPKEFQDVQQTIGKPRATIRFNPAGRPIKVMRGAVPPPAQAATPLPQAPSSPPIHDTTPENYLLPLPEQAVAVGETWKDRFDIVLRDDNKNLNRIIIQQNYKLTEVKNGRAVIDFRTVVLTPVNNPAILGQLIQREIVGKAVFDLGRGIVVSRESGVDNTVVGPFGAQSSMKAKSRYREIVVDDEAQAGPDAAVPAAVTATKK